MKTQRLCSTGSSFWGSVFLAIPLAASTALLAQSAPAAPAASATPAAPAETSPYPTTNNQWQLRYTAKTYSPTSKVYAAAMQVVGAPDSNQSAEVTKDFADLTNKITLANPSTACKNMDTSGSDACAATARSATELDDHHIHYNFRKWGGPCKIWLRINVFTPTTELKWSDLQPWSTNGPFEVDVPDGATDVTLFGKLNGANVSFVPSDPLSAADAKYFDVIEHAHPVPGKGTVYKFQTK